MSDCD
jgi:23S rRNA (uracil1939-C5)-methyltransferase